MILRAAIVFLLMLNLGVAAWWLGGAGVRAASAVPTIDGSQPGLRLVNEPVAAKPVTAAPVPASASTMATAAATPVSTAPNAPNATESATAPSAPVADTMLCISFGPFADAAARDAVRPRLQSLAEKLVARDTQARSGRGWRVYMPAMATRAAAQDVVDKIKAAGLSDWYIIANGEEANSIALGRYGSEESARRRQAQLAGKGFTARAESLGDTPPQSWLDARFPAGANRAALAAIALSRPLDCARLP